MVQCHNYLLKKRPDLLSPCLDYFCTLLIFKLSKGEGLYTNELVILTRSLHNQRCAKLFLPKAPFNQVITKVVPSDFYEIPREIHVILKYVAKAC